MLALLALVPFIASVLPTTLAAQGATWYALNYTLNNSLGVSRSNSNATSHCSSDFPCCSAFDIQDRP